VAVRRRALENMDLSGLFGGAFAGRRVLVTGHTGFKGSWLAYWLREMGAKVTGLALDPDSQPSHWQLLAPAGIADHRLDLRDAAAVHELVQHSRPEVVFHLAAQPLVRRSYRESVGTFAANVTGLINLFEALRECADVRAIVNATTDKVYEEQPRATGYRESDPLGGHDPYSTSKACAELVSACYRKSWFDGAGVRLATARAGNVIGGGDWAEDRLVPDLVRAATAGHALRIRNPEATRPWQHVLDPLSGYLRLGQALLAGEDVAEAWNFGPDGDGETTVRELSARLHAHWPRLQVQLDEGEHPHEAALLRLDCSKARQRLAWRPVWNLETGLDRTAAWYRAFHEHGQVRTGEDLRDYVGHARKDALAWAC
jgi:CDP-glucose 4,6-dehydratase